MTGFYHEAIRERDGLLTLPVSVARVDFPAVVGKIAA